MSTRRHGRVRNQALPYIVRRLMPLFNGLLATDRSGIDRDERHTALDDLNRCYPAHVGLVDRNRHRERIQSLRLSKPT